MRAGKFAAKEVPGRKGGEKNAVPPLLAWKKGKGSFLGSTEQKEKRSGVSPSIKAKRITFNFKGKKGGNHRKMPKEKPSPFNKKRGDVADGTFQPLPLGKEKGDLG